MNLCAKLAEDLQNWQIATALLAVASVVLFIVLIGVACYLGDEASTLREKADAYDRLRKMERLRGDTGKAYRKVVRAHARETDRIVSEARK